MKLQNLIFNKLGNSFSVMLANPEIEIMEKAESPILIEENQMFYEVEGISTIHTQDTVLAILLKLYSTGCEYPAMVRFVENGDVVLSIKDEIVGKFENGEYEFPLENPDPISVFKLSAYKPKYFSFVKEDTYKIKIKEEDILKGALELSYALNKDAS